jgi:hypothetical protein
MDTQRIGNLIDSNIGDVPADLDPDGLTILREAGFAWDAETRAFQREQPGHPARTPTARIEYRFLREQKLVVNSKLNKTERIGQLQRLRILVQGMD